MVKVTLVAELKSVCPKAQSFPTCHASTPGSTIPPALEQGESPPLLPAPCPAALRGRRSELPQAPFPPGSATWLCWFVTSRWDQLSQALSALCWCQSRRPASGPACGCPFPRAGCVRPPFLPLEPLHGQCASTDIAWPRKGLCVPNYPLAFPRPLGNQSLLRPSLFLE